MKKKLRVHFLGVGGAGMSAVALLAKHEGYDVTGCDLQETTPYLDKLKKAGVPVFVGHNESHLANTDLLTITAAAFFQSQDQPEFKIAEKEGKMIQWQEFLGKYLHKGKRVIAICGTNGKSTTTSLAGSVLEEGGLDPSAMVGATVKKWEANYRTGKSNLFVTESDEFFNNFLAYHPDIIILNNIEFDHPDFFKDFDDVIKTFNQFLDNIKGEKTLIFNQDDPGIKTLFDKVGEKYLKKLNLIGYTLEALPLIPTANSTKGTITKQDTEGTVFTAANPSLKLKTEFHLNLPGVFNVSNALGVINLATLLGVSPRSIDKTLSTFEGVGRRLDKIGETKDGIIVYEDYGHHPSAIKVTLEALRQRHPKEKIWAIVEPHTFSRTKAVLPLYKDAFAQADEVIIAPIFRSRDSSDFGISGNSIVEIANHPKISHINDFDQIIAYVMKNIKPKTVVIVFGAGKSYYLARDIFKPLTQQIKK